MMNFLAIDTTNSDLTVLFCDGKKVFKRRIATGKTGHSALLLPTVQAVLGEAEVSPDAIDAVAVVVGPGSFTGIRIGASAMTAVAYATNAKRVAVNYFELIAYSRREITAVVDAGHGNTYLAKCLDGKIISTDFVEEKDRDRIPSDALSTPCGNVEDVLAQVVKNKIAVGEFVDVFEPFYMRKSQAERNQE